MAGIKEHLGMYSLSKALEVDRSTSGCFVLDIGCDEEGNPINSLEHIIKMVDEHLANTSNLASPFTKLYVIGDWQATLDEENTKAEGSEAISKSMHERLDNTQLEQEWYEAVSKIANLIEHMPALKDLTWIAAIPFTSMLWKMLPTNLTKLVLDLGQPTHIECDGDIEYKSYIAQQDMRPLVQQTELHELRLFRMHDSMQAVVWETVFRNVSESGMRVVDLQMAAEPLVRMDHWHKAVDVVGLTIPKQDSNESEYKGIEGKGVLHHSFGTGEYLDAFCMRKARIAAGLEETKPLPLWCLKLNGFVVDYLPFEHELSRIALLTCGNDCIDSGLRAPKTPLTPHNRWSKIVNNATSHYLIQWPNWTGVFDDQGEQRDNHGAVVSQETGLSTSVNGPLSPDLMPLTKESLEMQNLKTALEDIGKQDEYPVPDPGYSSLEAVEIRKSMDSNASVCSSEVTEPAADPTAADFVDTDTGEGSDATEAADDGVSSEYPELATVDGSAAYGSPYSMTASLILVNTATTMSTDSSFDNVSLVDTEASASHATNGSKKTTAGENPASKGVGFKHKVRRSLDWLSGSRSDSGDGS